MRDVAGTPVRVDILARNEVFRRSIFRIEEIRLRHELFDGSMGKEITRLVLHRGDSVALLLHDPEKEIVLLCEQFRAPTIGHGDGWLMELPAGMVEEAEDAEECAKREALEETGYAVRNLRKVASVYLSPGGSSERVHIFYGQISVAERSGPGGGVVSEGEDIRLLAVPVGDTLFRVREGRIGDAKTLIALQWLEATGRA
jgi:nudix-type nucleoside diphosphatase (YffH/AdpP family)